MLWATWHRIRILLSTHSYIHIHICAARSGGAFSLSLLLMRRGCFVFLHSCMHHHDSKPISTQIRVEQPRADVVRSPGNA